MNFRGDNYPDTGGYDENVKLKDIAESISKHYSFENPPYKYSFDHINIWKNMPSETEKELKHKNDFKYLSEEHDGVLYPTEMSRINKITPSVVKVDYDRSHNNFTSHLWILLSHVKEFNKLTDEDVIIVSFLRSDSTQMTHIPIPSDYSDTARFHYIKTIISKEYMKEKNVNIVKGTLNTHIWRNAPKEEKNELIKTNDFKYLSKNGLYLKNKTEKIKRKSKEKTRSVSSSGSKKTPPSLEEDLQRLRTELHDKREVQVENIQTLKNTIELIETHSKNLDTISRNNAKSKPSETKDKPLTLKEPIPLIYILKKIKELAPNDKKRAQLEQNAIDIIKEEGNTIDFKRHFYQPSYDPLQLAFDSGCPNIVSMIIENSNPSQNQDLKDNLDRMKLETENKIDEANEAIKYIDTTDGNLQKKINELRQPKKTASTPKTTSTKKTTSIQKPHQTVIYGNSNFFQKSCDDKVKASIQYNTMVKDKPEITLDQNGVLTITFADSTQATSARKSVLFGTTEEDKQQTCVLKAKQINIKNSKMTEDFIRNCGVNPKTFKDEALKAEKTKEAETTIRPVK